MKKLLPLLTALILAGCNLPFIGQKNSGLKVSSTPQATVTLDGEQLGVTPLEKDQLKPGQHQLQLVSESSQPWVTNITLNDQLQTVVNHVFGPTEQESAGYIMTLEKIDSDQNPELTVISIPDHAIVRLDGQPIGFAPTSSPVSSEGNHEATVSSAGYKESKIPIQIPPGHRLLLTVQLSRTPLLPPAPEATESALPADQDVTSTGSAAVKPYVEILDTPTGWLRVRSQPTTAGDNEITKVNPGETYKFLESNETGWYRIKLPDGKEGWISGQYAKLYR